MGAITIRSLFKMVLVVMIIIGFSVTLMQLFVRARGDSPEFFGVSSYVILSDSMPPVIKAGDMVFIRRHEPSRLEEGDIITFRSTDPRTFGETITHQIDEVVTDEGSLSFITKGINLDSQDPTPVAAGNVKGVYWFRLPYAGYVVQFIQSDTGFLTLFILPISTFIVFEIMHFTRIYKAYVKENILYELEQKQQQQSNNK